MKYFIDTEFVEGFHKPLFGTKRHFIDLISIGIVAEDGREYYAVGHDFDLKYAWNDVWIRNNVIRSIHTELCKRVGNYAKTYHYNLFEPFKYKSVYTLLKWYGLPNSKILRQVKDFIAYPSILTELPPPTKPEFYGYFADYDWVLFCSLFGRMIDLPNGYPMYCRDLKQMLDEAYIYQENKYEGEGRLESWLKTVKNHPLYPKQQNEHNALDDARWNKRIFHFITEKAFLVNDPPQPQTVIPRYDSMR